MTHALEIQAEQRALDCVLLPLLFHYPSEDKSVSEILVRRFFEFFLQPLAVMSGLLALVIR